MANTQFTITNNSATALVYQGQTIGPSESYTPPAASQNIFASDPGVIADLLANAITITIGSNTWSGQPAVSVLNTLKPDPAPFAAPAYRTKRDGTPSVVTIAPGASEIIDYQITEERYVQGGQILVSGAQLGDYITAEVYDKDSVLPEAYRGVLCEAWPSVTKYIVKEWLSHDGNHIINTYPLNAKIPARFYLRVTYYACSDGSDRKAVVNYYLTKKL